MFCSKCKGVIRDQDRCYQIRYGHWEEADAHHQGDFIAKEDTAYYHEECLPNEIGYHLASAYVRLKRE